MEIVAGCSIKNTHTHTQKVKKCICICIQCTWHSSRFCRRCLIKSIKIESHFKRRYNAHNRNVQICQGNPRPDECVGVACAERDEVAAYGQRLEHLKMLETLSTRKSRSTLRPAARLDVCSIPSWAFGAFGDRQRLLLFFFPGNQFSSAPRLSTK